MRLLENLVSDLIRDSTGLNTRRLVRRIGGGKILLAGGAALAGAFLADKAQTKTPEQAASPSSSQPAGAPGLPPLPPVPAASLPPLPGGATSPPSAPAPPVSSMEPAPTNAPAPPKEDKPQELSPDLEFAVIRSMVAAALADGHLGTEERHRILERVDASELPEARRRKIHEDLVLPPTPSELAALVPEAEEREILFTFAALTCHQDDAFHAQEEGWLQRFATALELPEDRRRRLSQEAESLTQKRSDPSSSPD